MIRIVVPLLLLIAQLATPAVAAEPTFSLRGVITDLAGAPVADAEVYLYRTTNTRRPAEYISPKTSATGAFRLVVPAGTYYGVARIKQGERFGPLQLGQRHSGDPQQIVIGEEPETTVDFVVADLRELAMKRAKISPDVVTITGIITDREGAPVANAYAFARTGEVQATLPEYLSAWTGPDGRFTLFLPPGNYLWGASREFPPPILPQLLPAPAAEGKGDLKLVVGE